MKHLLFFTIAAMITACGGDETPIKKTTGKLDPDAMVRIEAANGVKMRSNELEYQYTEDGERLLTAFEIAKQGILLEFFATFEGQKAVQGYNTSRVFGDNMRDTVSERPALLMFGTDIIREDGTLVKNFLYGRDVVVSRELLDKNGKPYGLDTIGYIPNALLVEAQKKIEAAYNDSNYTEVYRLFNEVYRFKPTTGKQWKRLKAQGLQ